MTELLLLFPLACLANWQAVETLHHGDIFADLRARLESSDSFFARLFLCPFCLSHWTSFIISFILFISYYLSAPSAWPVCPIHLVYWLSVTRMSNVLNDLGHSRWRTPKHLNLEEEMAALGEVSSAPPTTDHGQEETPTTPDAGTAEPDV